MKTCCTLKGRPVNTILNPIRVSSEVSKACPVLSLTAAAVVVGEVPPSPSPAIRTVNTLPKCRQHCPIVRQARACPVDGWIAAAGECGSGSVVSVGIASDGQRDLPQPPLLPPSCFSATAITERCEMCSLSQMCVSSGCPNLQITCSRKLTSDYLRICTFRHSRVQHGFCQSRTDIYAYTFLLRGSGNFT